MSERLNAVRLEWRNEEYVTPEGVRRIALAENATRDFVAAYQAAEQASITSFADYILVTENARKILANHDVQAQSWLIDQAVVKGFTSVHQHCFEYAKVERQRVPVRYFGSLLNNQLVQLKKTRGVSAAMVANRIVRTHAHVSTLRDRPDRPSTRTPSQEDAKKIIDTIAELHKLSDEARTEFFKYAWEYINSGPSKHDDGYAASGKASQSKHPQDHHAIIQASIDATERHWQVVTEELEASIQVLDQPDQDILRSNQQLRDQSRHTDQAAITARKKRQSVRRQRFMSEIILEKRSESETFGSRYREQLNIFRITEKEFVALMGDSQHTYNLKSLDERKALPRPETVLQVAYAIAEIKGIVGVEQEEFIEEAIRYAKNSIFHLLDSAYAQLIDKGGCQDIITRDSFGYQLPERKRVKTPDGFDKWLDDELTRLQELYGKYAISADVIAQTANVSGGLISMYRDRLRTPTPQTVLPIIKAIADESGLAGAEYTKFVEHGIKCAKNSVRYILDEAYAGLAWNDWSDPAEKTAVRLQEQAVAEVGIENVETENDTDVNRLVNQLKIVHLSLGLKLPGVLKGTVSEVTARVPLSELADRYDELKTRLKEQKKANSTQDT